MAGGFNIDALQAMMKPQLSYSESIQKFKEMPQEEQAAEREKLLNEADAAERYRSGSSRTKADQDRKLKAFEDFLVDYLEVLKPRVDKADTVPLHEDEERLKEMFPYKPKTLKCHVRAFLMHVAATVPGRSSIDQRISYTSLSKYRSAMLYWVAYVCEKNNHPLIDVSKSATKGMVSVSKQLKIKLKSSARPSSLGSEELHHLIDFDMSKNKSIEITEQHHLAWCIGRVCAIRPCSLATPPTKHRDYDDDFMSWRDIQITRTSRVGDYEVWLTFRNFKGSRNLEGQLRGSVRDEPIRCRILSPKSPRNLVFNIAHRLVVIALRRGILKDISSMEELLGGEKRHIQIRDEYLDLPIFVAGKFGGKTIVENTPMTANALTIYLQERAFRCGFAANITFYGLRHRSLTNLYRKIGPDATRAIAGHTPQSRILERHYVHLEGTTNLMALALNENVGKGGQDVAMMKDDHQALLERLTPEAIEKSSGAAVQVVINDLIRELANQDPQFLVGKSFQERKSWLARARRAASRGLREEQLKLVKDEMTVAQYEERIQDMERLSKFTQGVIANTRKYMQEQETFGKLSRAVKAHTAHNPTGSLENHENDLTQVDYGAAKAYIVRVFAKDNETHSEFDDNDSQFDDTDSDSEENEYSAVKVATADGDEVDDGCIDDAIDFPPEEDLEQLVSMQGGLRNIDRPVMREEEDDGLDLDFAKLAEVFMKALLDNSITSHRDWKNDGGLRCPACEADETINEKAKAKLWRDQYDLDQHLLTEFHFPINTLKRKYENLAEVDENIQCPGCYEQFQGLGKFFRHLNKVTDAKHRAAKAKGGLFISLTIPENRELMRANKRILKRTATERHQLPLPSPDIPGLSIRYPHIRVERTMEEGEVEGLKSINLDGGAVRWQDLSDPKIDLTGLELKIVT